MGVVSDVVIYDPVLPFYPLDECHRLSILPDDELVREYELEGFEPGVVQGAHDDRCAALGGRHNVAGLTLAYVTGVHVVEFDVGFVSLDLAVVPAVELGNSLLGRLLPTF